MQSTGKNIKWLQNGTVPDVGRVYEELERIFRGATGRSKPRLLLPLELPHALLPVR